MLSDIEIANQVKLKPITEIAEKYTRQNQKKGIIVEK